jgi:hypothetical protein
MRPVQVQIIAFAPTVFYHCQHCELTFREAGFGDRFHREQAREALPEDLLQDYRDLSVWAHSLMQRHGSGVRVKVVDAASIEGFMKSLRHGIRRYPAVVVDGRSAHDWKDLETLTGRRWRDRLNPGVERLDGSVARGGVGLERPDVKEVGR